MSETCRVRGSYCLVCWVRNCLCDGWLEKPVFNEKREYKLFNKPDWKDE